MAGKRILVCWIGNTDLKASAGESGVGLGPIAQAAKACPFDLILLLSDHTKDVAATYKKWLVAQTSSAIEVRQHKLPGPTDFGEIYKAATEELAELRTSYGDSAEFTFHLSPGTPAMAAVWILLAKTRFPADLIESSKEHGVRAAQVPFDISAEFIPDLLRRSDQRMARLAQGLTDDVPEFADIIYRSPQMKRVIEQAQRIAIRSIPVLIEGESGTGKELLARAIHRASPRAAKPFITVNCGAIPSELVESEFFGHKKGAFTGASADRAGHFEQANGGTLFLDEIGDLPKPVQVKLLRALQEGEVVRIGDSAPRKADVRIIAATHRNLPKEIADGNFREDLFFRLAVAILKLPPIRERSGDLTLLIDRLMEKVNSETAVDAKPGHKNISVSARNVMLKHAWPGNVRELQNTLYRVAVSSDEKEISAEAMQEAILDLGPASGQQDTVLNRPIEEGVDLQGIINEVARHYLSRALAVAHGNKSQATRILGLPNYQTLTNWMKRYGVSK